MRRLIMPAVILITALILSGSFFLPSYVSDLRDKQTIETLSQAEGISVNFETATKMSMIERLDFVMNAGSIELDNGKNLDNETAYQHALTELRNFNTSGLMNFDFDNCSLSKYGVSFYIDSADPTKNLIAWNLFIEDKSSHAITVFIDDETGKLLSVGYTYVYGPQKYYPKESIIGAGSGKLIIAPDALTAAVASYYNVQAVQQNYDKRDKYQKFSLNLSDGKSTVSIDAAIVVDGFWFNI